MPSHSSFSAAEQARLKELQRYRILDTETEEEYDEIAQLAATICRTPIALISFVDAVRQWFKARVGLPLQETPRELSFCSYAIQRPGTMIIEDATLDERFRSNPLVTDDPHIRFYAGAPLVTRSGHALGTLCVIDKHPRGLRPEQLSGLETLARSVSRLLEYRFMNQALTEERHAQTQFHALMAHDLRTPFNGLLSLSEELERSAAEGDLDMIRGDAHLIRQCANSAHELLENLLAWSNERNGLNEPKLTPVRLTPLIHETCDHLRSHALDKNIALDIKSRADFVFPTDERMVSTVLRNLISNALKFSPEQATVSIGLEADELGQPRFSVQDQGEGVPPEILDQLNTGEPIASQHGTAGERGSGLGLSLSQKLLGHLGSRLEIENVAGNGARISFTLPNPA